jgi:hypothetical protein
MKLKPCTPFLFLLILILPSSISAQLMWQTLPSPAGTLVHLDMNDNGVLATFQNGNPIQPKISTDQGTTWQTKAGSGGPNSIALFDQRWHISNPGVLLFLGSTGASNLMWRSDDGGDNFTVVATPPQGFFFDFVSAPNGDVYLYGEGVARSTDNGVTWTQIVPGNTTYQAFTVNTTNIFAADFSGMNVGNLDGTNFQSVSTAPANANPVLAMTAGFNGRIIAVGQNDLAMTSVDNGATWQLANGGLAPGVTELDQVAASPIADIWLATKQVSVRYTDDAGSSWITTQNGLTLAPNEPILGAFCDQNQTFFIYNYSGIYRAAATTSVAEPTVLMDPDRVYPNPTDGSVKLPLLFRNTTVLVTDLSGRSVREAFVPANGNLDLGGLRTGSYIVNRTNSNESVRVIVEEK